MSHCLIRETFQKNLFTYQVSFFIHSSHEMQFPPVLELLCFSFFFNNVEEINFDVNMYKSNSKKAGKVLLQCNVCHNVLIMGLVLRIVFCRDNISMLFMHEKVFGVLLYGCICVTKR